jgi:hypothetical protein
MPYPNFHACRVRDPKDFEEDSFRSIELPKSEGGKGGVIVILGRLNGKTTMTAQAYRFPKSKYTVDEAKEWTKKYNIKCKTFEPASKEKAEIESFVDNVIQIDKEVYSDIDIQALIDTFDGRGGKESKCEGDNCNMSENEIIVENKVYFEKVSAKKRIVYGVVYEPDMADSHKQFMTADAIEDMAHIWLMNFGKMDEHHDFINGSGYPVESFIVKEGDKTWVDKNGKTRVGAWVLGAKVTDDKVWKQIERGEIKAFSWAGVGWLGKEKEVESDWFDNDGNKINPYDVG